MLSRIFTVSWLALIAALSLRAGAQSTAAMDAASVDRAMQAAWRKAQIRPSEPASDAQFLRRAYLDITGTIPPAQVVTEFLADRAPDKRARAIAALLESPGYANHWTEYWDSVLMGRQKSGAFVDPGAFKDWLHDQLARNVPYNKLVTDLITATGQSSTGRTYAEAYGVAMAGAGKPIVISPAGASRINGAVNWTIKRNEAPADLAGITARVFLGVQIQCAQCHDHKTEKWKQDDFRRFAACLVQTAGIPVGGAMAGQNAATNVVALDLRDVNVPYLGNKYNGGPDRDQYVLAAPTALDGTAITGPRAARRKALAVWITAKDNPWFAKALVNRLWSRFLGRGFVEPIDDFRPSNPPVLPEALDLLAARFVAHDYDLKYLIETICSTQAYQLSPGPAPPADPDNRLDARFRIRPVETDELLNSLIAATNFQTVLARLPGGGVDQIKARILRGLTFVFDTDEEAVERKEFEGTIPQALLLLNGALTNNAVSPIPGTALADVLATPGPEANRIEAVYLRTLSRKPTAAELQRWTAFVDAPRTVVLRPTAAKPAEQPSASSQYRVSQTPIRPVYARVTARQQAYEDMFWALLNSSEFVFNH